MIYSPFGGLEEFCWNGLEKKLVVTEFICCLKNIFRKQQLFVNINGQKCPILGRIGTYHVTVDITGKDVKINDEAIFNTNIKHVDSSIKRVWS